MTNLWHDKPPKDEHEPDAMASVLEAMHGVYAAEVAEFFSEVHLKSGDKTRSTAWANVAELVRERQRERMDS